MQYVPEMLEMGIDMWTPQANANDPDSCTTPMETDDLLFPRQ